MSGLSLRLASAVGLAVAACVGFSAGGSLAHAAASPTAAENKPKPPKWKVTVNTTGDTTITVVISCPLPGEANAFLVAKFNCQVLFLAADNTTLGRDTVGSERMGTGAARATTILPTPAGTAKIRIVCNGSVQPWGDASEYDTEFES